MSERKLQEVFEELRLAKKLPQLESASVYKKSVEQMMPYSQEVTLTCDFYRLDCLVEFCQKYDIDFDYIPNEVFDFFSLLVSRINWEWVEDFETSAAKAEEWKERILLYKDLMDGM